MTRLITKMLVCMFGVPTMILAQQPLLPNGAAGVGPDWMRGGNNIPLFPPALQNNRFGTFPPQQSSVYTFTGGVLRSVLNCNMTATINGVAGFNNSGFMGLGSSASANNLWTTTGPRSMLHLEGPNNTLFGGNGWRSWMQTGIFMKEHSDAMYVGLKPDVTTTNRSDAIINWSDDAGTGGGVDKLRFLFTSVAPGNGSNTNPLSGSSFDGYEFMRMVSIPGVLNSAGYPIGHVGIGPVFTNALPPQSRLHLNAENNIECFSQFSNQGTGQGAQDGLRVGT